MSAAAGGAGTEAPAGADALLSDIDADLAVIASTSSADGDIAAACERLARAAADGGVCAALVSRGCVLHLVAVLAARTLSEAVAAAATAALWATVCGGDTAGGGVQRAVVPRVRGRRQRSSDCGGGRHRRRR